MSVAGAATRWPRVAALRTPAALRARLEELGWPLPCDDAALAAPDSPLARPLALGEMNGRAQTAANRFVVQPMEGWDGTPDGRPTALTERRWRNFGRSGAALVWGGEAVAVVEEGRANPHQLVLSPATAPVDGSIGIWPDVKTSPPAITPCEYGPIAAGASVVAITFISFLSF